MALAGRLAAGEGRNRAGPGAPRGRGYRAASSWQCLSDPL